MPLSSCVLSAMCCPCMGASLVFYKWKQRLAQFCSENIHCLTVCHNTLIIPITEMWVIADLCSVGNTELLASHSDKLRPGTPQSIAGPLCSPWENTIFGYVMFHSLCCKHCVGTETAGITGIPLPHSERIFEMELSSCERAMWSGMAFLPKRPFLLSQGVACV